MTLRGLRLVGLSEVYPFNDWNADRRGAVAALIAAAEAAGAETISLIPRVDVRDPDPNARAAALRAVVAEIAPMLAGTRVVALLEPIGFTTCSFRTNASFQDLTPDVPIKSPRPPRRRPTGSGR